MQGPPVQLVPLMKRKGFFNRKRSSLVAKEVTESRMCIGYVEKGTPNVTCYQ